jgi:hypothetical protein
MVYQDNTQNYRESITERTRADEAYLPFTATVLTVDYERKVLTLQDDKSSLVYSEVRIFPALSSSAESSDIMMPEPGTKCVATSLTQSGGFSEVIVLTWLLSATLGAIDAIAQRGPEGIEGLTQRRRGTYRKAYPGQKTMTTTSGFSEKIDDGWDTLSSDFSRDKLDALRRQRAQITSRNIRYSDAGLCFEGPVNRNGQDLGNYQPQIMPDGTLQYVLFLNSNASLADRYVNGTQDVIALSEKVEKVQEFALDYPVPLEVLEAQLLDHILGTTAPIAARTTIAKANTVVDGQTYQVSYDSESFMVNQPWDNPQSRTASAVGPTLNEGITPARRGFMIEKAEGTLVGSNLFDTVTYGYPLMPILNPNTYLGRFGADFESGYLPVPANQDPNHTWTRMATSAYSIRFPYEYNTTRWDITKEGMLIFEIGASIPDDNNPFSDSYEYIHGAGRSVEGHLVGSLKLVIGKDRDEEDSVDLQALGQSVLRLGADDCSLPDDRRDVETQSRYQFDAVQKRNAQYWSLKDRTLQTLGNPLSLTNKVCGENISIRGATDGGVVMRFGARTPLTKRCHLQNGYQDAQGRTYLVPNQSPNRLDSKSPGRPNYGFGDSNYQFHDLTRAGAPSTPAYASQTIYGWSGQPVLSMDRQGLSIDFHTVRDILIRAGKDEDNGQSLLMDLAGGIVAWFGADQQGRSLAATLDGGIEMSIGANKQGNGLQLDIVGNMNVTVKGNYHLNVTGDYVMECNSYRETVHTDAVKVSQKTIESSLARHTTESPDIVHNQGTYVSNANT